MFRHVDDFPRRIWVRQDALYLIKPGKIDNIECQVDLVVLVAQVIKGAAESREDFRAEVRGVLPQQLHFRREIRIINGMHAEEIAAFAEEVVP